METTFFLNEKKYFDNLIVWRMLATFKFELVGRGVSGKLKVDFNFHEFQKDKSHKAPLEINLISALELDNNNISSSQKDDVKKTLLAKFEELKSVIYQNHFAPLV